MNTGNETWKSHVEAELLAIASVADHLKGPFQSGYLQAIEEIAERLGLSDEVRNVSTYEVASLEHPLDTFQRHMAALGDALGANDVEKAKLAQMELATFVRPFVASLPNPYIADSACTLVARCHGWLNRFSPAPDATLWGGRATGLINGLAQALCFLRDRGYVRLSAGHFMDLLNLRAIEHLVWSHSIAIRGMELRIDDAAFATALEPLTQFVLNLPGYRRERAGKQDLITQEKFDYVAMVASGPIRGIAATTPSNSIASGAKMDEGIGG